MYEAFVDINHVPTHVVTWGKWIEEDLSDVDSIVLFIPGNPGLPAFYKSFLETIYQQLGERTPVWTLGHGGHEKPSQTSLREVPPIKQNEHLYVLKGQIEHKVAFFKKYIPKTTKVYVIGHSIGAYIGLELLKDPALNAQIAKEYLLFPTIERMGATPHGRFLNNIVRYIVFILVFLTWFLTCLPGFLQNILVSVYLLVTATPLCNLPMTMQFLNPNTINSVLFMALDEMENVRERDDKVIIENKEKIKLYYGTTDRWVPVSYYRALKERHPDVDAELCVNHYEHAFVLKNAKEVGIMVATWIKNHS